MKATKLKTEHMVNPIGLQTINPTLSWVCDGGITQTAYQIIAKSGDAIVWNSGKVASSQMAVPYGGSAAKAEKKSIGALSSGMRTMRTGKWKQPALRWV